MRWSLLACLLIGCSADEQAPRREAVKLELATKAQATSRTFRFGENELLLIEVPVQSGRRVDFQRCFVWRDVTNGSSQMQCPGEPDAAMTRLPDDPLGVAERY